MRCFTTGDGLCQPGWVELADQMKGCVGGEFAAKSLTPSLPRPTLFGVSATPPGGGRLTLDAQHQNQAKLESYL